MLRNAKDLRGFALLATDRVIGKVDDLYFDDEDWSIRYLVVNTSGDAWLNEVGPSTALRKWFSHDPGKCLPSTLLPRARLAS